MSTLYFKHRRGKWGAWGGSCPPPLRLESWAIFGTKKTLLIRRRYFLLFCFVRERLILGQKHSKSGEDPFFILFYFFGGGAKNNLVFGAKNNPISAKNPVSRSRLWCLWSCPPLS